MSVRETTFIVEGAKRAYKYNVTLEESDGRIYFLKSPFALKDEIKAMQGAKWHGRIEGDNRKIWSIADTGRNRFQLEWLEGGDPYAWFDQPLIQHDYPQFGSPGFGFYNLMSQQRLMADTGLTYHYQIWGAEMGTGKTLAAIATMVMSGQKGWWWVGPRSSLYGIRQQFAMWGLPQDVVTEMMSYESLMQKMRTWKQGTPAPIGIIIDESQRVKTPNAQRTQAAQFLADSIRAEHGRDGYVILMTGTPSPKSPGDWWSQCEIAWPGFIKEGSRDAFERRLGFFRLQDNLSGTFNTLVAWRDDARRCAICGQYREEGHHMLDDGEIVQEDETFDIHIWEPSVNEVAGLYERLKGLVTIVHKKDCLELPDKIYRVIDCEPSPSTLRVAQAITRTATNTISGLTLLRELSDGFQYRDIEDGVRPCDACTDGFVKEFYHPHDPGASITHVELLSPEFVEQLEERIVHCPTCGGSKEVKNYKRISREVPCPKEDAIIDLLDENFEQGRIVIFAGFTGSLDRLVRIAHREGWDTLRVDGQGWRIERLVGTPKANSEPVIEVVKLDNPLDYWINPKNTRVAFIAHPKSGGVSLTLCEQPNVPGAVMSVFYSNDYDPASRIQAEDRIHRTSMNVMKGATIVDLMHLPTDRRILSVLRENRKIELMTMGEFEKDYERVNNE